MLLGWGLCVCSWSYEGHLARWGIGRPLGAGRVLCGGDVTVLALHRWDKVLASSLSGRKDKLIEEGTLYLKVARKPRERKKAQCPL